ncbi:hypothetical protein ANN_12447 [Periplaneta americana]|uniref:P/Homo B domain-containing protein n=1 Tax=Periplaneta americana TaxID=6978 RepID=A0ABQ8TII2_PERAM|nr:hypothetical protein ANN_12447 [Periplaneta americana]
MPFRITSIQDDPAWRTTQFNSLLPCWMLIADGLRTVNADYYCRFMQHHLRPALRRKRRHLVVQNPIILHDNPRSHTLLLSRTLASLAMGDSGTSTVLTRYDPCDYDLFTKAIVVTAVDRVVFAGVRMLDGDVTDAVEARSLSLNPQHIDIYSASWGPDDDGKTVDGPGELATRAFIEGVTKGRSGKGSIFVWASGNGGRDHDNCNCDGYTNSIWTLSISSATENGYVPWYSEACSSTLATTYSSGASGEKQVVTTDLHHMCTSSHTGTSASAPLAAGICALALESNRELTWRDMQHIVVRTARPANLKSPDWKVNGVGRNVSHSFGYGLMDAYAMVKLARNWKTVPEQHKCEVSAPHTDKLIPAKSHVSLQLHVKECAGVNFLEHVQAKVSLMSSRRGDLQIHLTSPAGTRATLLARRPHDVSRAGFQAWPFMSVHTWGEKPFGIWQLEIHNEGRFLGRATLQEWALIFYGTAVTPDGHGGHSPPIPPLRPTNTGSSSSLKPPRPNLVLIPPSYPVSPPKIYKNSHKNRTKTAKLTPPRTLLTTTPANLPFMRVLQPTSPSVPKPRIKSTTTPAPTLSRRPNTRPVTTSTTSTTTSSTFTNITLPPPLTTSNITTTFTTTTSTTTHTTTATTTTTTTSLGSDLTILLEVPSHSPPKVPEDIFKQYPKIQKVYPVYSLSKSRIDPSSFHPASNLVPNLELVQEGSRLHQGEGKASHFMLMNADPLPVCCVVSVFAGTLKDWKLVFYGTETSPEGEEHEEDEEDDIHQDIVGSNKVGPPPIGVVEQDPGHNEVESVIGSGRVDSADLTRNEVQRTTTEDDAPPSSGCIALSKKGQHCIERIPNLSAEQSDGITVFRISMMTSLMLHQCRTDAISLQSMDKFISGIVPGPSQWFFHFGEKIVIAWIISGEYGGCSSSPRFPSALEHFV